MFVVLDVYVCSVGIHMFVVLDVYVCSVGIHMFVVLVFICL